MSIEFLDQVGDLVVIGILDQVRDQVEDLVVIGFLDQVGDQVVIGFLDQVGDLVVIRFLDYRRPGCHRISRPGWKPGCHCQMELKTGFIEN